MERTQLTGFMAIPPPLPNARLQAKDLQDLRHAKALLENPGLAMRLANLVGTPLEKGFKLLPQGWTDVVHKAARAALTRALNVAVASLGTRARATASEKFHKILVGASGGVGGAFGLAAVPVELPISTTFMLRSIADIARSEGHDLQSASVKFACLEVFALGGKAKSDDASESGYWAIRTALAKAVSEAAAYVAQRGVLEQSAPAVVRFIAAIAARFGVIVSEQVAAKAVPVIGAASGSVINILFMEHFQNMARGHFIVKRLEAKYGVARIREAYEQIAFSRASSPE
ncbi:MAG TPA: EcsC family protein [Verrucomicrobiae bacterium]|nr:EcsC family protein [Verrucomicrobiae bacterium]